MTRPPSLAGALKLDRRAFVPQTIAAGAALALPRCSSSKEERSVLPQNPKLCRAKTLRDYALICIVVTLLGAGPNHAATEGQSATIQELMATKVDPSADALWASVSTTITAGGTDEKQPRTDADWRAARQLAVNLIEGANLLAAPKQRVAPLGHTTEDSTVPGIERPENIQKAIDQDPESFTRAALLLRDAGLGALAAIDQKSAQGLVTAGGDLDAACEACHLKYWYPHSPRPKNQYAYSN
jgi:hypothetical protein